MIVSFQESAKKKRCIGVLAHLPPVATPTEQEQVPSVRPSVRPPLLGTSVTEREDVGRVPVAVQVKMKGKVKS